MVNLDYSLTSARFEIDRIVDFIRRESQPEFPLVLGLSGGVDSDVCARLCAQAVGPERLKCVMILQADFDPKYVKQARELTDDIGVQLVEVPLADVPIQLMSVLADSDPRMGFSADPAFLDVGRSKCAIRTFVFSAYAERGHLVIGPSNRTELQLGYFLPFGDALAHIRPLAHLYKTQVLQLAAILGTRPEVLTQQPAAGFWIGDEDLKGIAYWLYNGGPIEIDLDLNTDEKAKIREFRNELSFRAVDLALAGFSEEWEPEALARQTGLSKSTIQRLRLLTEKAYVYKRRKLGAELSES